MRSNSGNRVARGFVQVGSPGSKEPREKSYRTEDPPISGATDICNCSALRKASRWISQLYDAALAPCGLRATQRAILAQVARTGTPTVGELADDLVLDRSALAHNIKPLVRDGFLAVAVDPSDRRVRTIILTKRGRAKLDEADVLWSQVQRDFEKAYGAGNARTLRSTLNQMVSTDMEMG